MRAKDALFATLALVLGLAWTTVAIRAWPAVVPSTSATESPSPTGSVEAPRLPGRIAFVKGSEIHLLENSRSGPITSGGGHREPALTRDGSRVAYTTVGIVEGRRIVEGQNVPGHLAYESIVVRPTAGGAEQVLVDGLQRRDARGFHSVEFEMQPTWSPDATELAFISDDGNGADLKVIVLASGAVRTLSRGSVLADPEWSPDGRTIAATTYTSDEAGILLVRADGSGSQRLRVDRAGEPYRPSFSPDGRWILVTLRTDRGNDLVAVSIDGGATVDVTKDGRSWGGVFSPEGDHVAFLRENEGNIDLFALELRDLLAGGTAGTLLALTRGGADGTSRPSWSR